MAFKFILGRHIKAILNDAEEKQKKDIKDYAGGHLNESVLLRAPLAQHRRSWASAHTENIPLIKSNKSLHTPQELNNTRSSKDVLYDFVLGTSGVIPHVQENTSKTPEIRYRIFKDTEKAKKKKEPGSRTPKSLYSELEDGILVEELQTREQVIPDHSIHERTTVKDVVDIQHSLTADSMFTSEASCTKTSQLEQPALIRNYFLPHQNQEITRKDRYRKMKAFDVAVLQKKEVSEKMKILSGEKTARHHEKKLQQELDKLNPDNVGLNLHRLQVCSVVLDDIQKESPSLSYILHCIQTEYDNYICKLLEDQAAQQHYHSSQVDQMTSRGTSRPSEMEAATAILTSLEAEARYVLDLNKRLREQVKTEHEHLNQTPEVPAVKMSVTEGYIKKDQPTELSMELENMKALILEKLDELNSVRLKSRAEYVPVTVCTHIEQCIKETEVEVQKLLKQNEYFERSIAEMEADLREAIIEADTSEKDARRIWQKVNSTRGLPCVQKEPGAENDEDDDDESKWNWYIS